MGNIITKMKGRNENEEEENKVEEMLNQFGLTEHTKNILKKHYKNNSLNFINLCEGN
jgi:ABC-type multidrug transport system ATPase subunit